MFFQGQFFSGSSYRIYLLGNPIIWWSNLLFLLLFLIVFIINVIKQRREDGFRYLQLKTNKVSNNEKKSSDSNIQSKCIFEFLFINMQCYFTFYLILILDCSRNSMSLQASIWLFFGWVIHYLPFWAMGRVLYFHHYFPALIFNSMLSGNFIHNNIIQLNKIF